MKSRRWGKRIVVLTAVFSLVLTTLSPLILTRTAYAAGQSNILQNGQIEATLSARFLHACLDSWGSYEAVNGKDIIDFKWSTGTGSDRSRALLNGDGSAGLTINNSGGVALYETRYTITGDGNGYYENNIPGCNATTIKGAFSKLTTDNGGGILCKMGFMQSQYKDGNYGCLPSNAAWYYSGNDSFPAGAFDQISKNINDFPAAAKNNITLSYKGKEAINNYAAAKKGTLNDEALWYAYDLYGQTSANAAQGSVLSATQSSSYTEPITIWTYDASRNMHYTETWYAKTGQSGAVGLQKLKDNGGKPSAAAQAFFNAVGSKTMEETITALCNAKYKPENKKGTELRDACVKGAQNQSNAEYCPTTYAEKTSDNSASELQTACKDGQGLDVGNDDTTNPSPDDTTDQNTCYTADTQGFGWLVCPGLTWMTAAIDGIITLITSGLQWSMLADGNGAVTIKAVWNSMLGIANIAFAIVFMIIIYSTATSTGISNYGIKKIFPRLVVAAVGVNLSFYLCAALADLSNIAGVGLNNLILNQMTGIDMTGAGMFSRLFEGLTQLGAMLLIALLAWSAVLIGLVTILFSIALRSVVLTMLVIVSPLAIVAMMLPNTEKWFKKWRDTFIQLLVIYPAFMAAWAACRLVSNVVAQTQGIGWLLSALCTIVPVAIILPLIKAPPLMNKLTGLAEKGIGAAGGNALKGINAQQRQLMGQRVLSGFRGVATRGLAGKKAAMDSAASDLSAREKDKAARTFSAEETKRLGELSAKGATRTSDEQKELIALNAKRVKINKGTIPYWSAADEQELSNAQQKATNTANAYRRQTNGAFYRTVFGGAHRRAAIANIKHENELADQQALGRRLSEDDRFQRSYSGVMPGMDKAVADARTGRAFGQSQVIANKESQEALDRAGAIIGNLVKEDGNAVQNGDLIAALKNGTTISGTVDGRQMVLNPKDSAMRMQMSSIVGKFGSAAEVGDLIDVARATDDALVRQYIVNQVAQSSKAPAEMAGANVPAFAAGAISRVEGAAAMLSRGDFRTEVLANKQAGELQMTMNTVSDAISAQLKGATQYAGQDINKMVTNFDSTVQALLDSNQSSVITGNPNKLAQIVKYAGASGKTFSFGGHSIDGTGYH